MLLIRNVQIVDGTGKPPYGGDVLVKDDRISAIGSFPNKKVDAVINGNGAYLTPGFIDVNTDSDHYLTLFTNPEQQDFLLQGVTTIMGGHCGSSLAPLLRGDLRSIRKWTNPNIINVDWRYTSEFLQKLEQCGLGVNFGTLVGHSTIRRALIGEALRDLTDDERGKFEFVLQQALKEGAFGMSTGLAYVHARQAPYTELKELLRVVKEYNGVYATHLRDEEAGLVASINETFELAAETNVKTLVSHFRPLLGFEKEFQNAVQLMSDRGEDLKMYFDTYPSDTSMTTIYRLLPEWAQTGSLEVMLKVLNDGTTAKRILKEFRALDPDRIVVAQIPGYEFLTNRTLREFAKNRELSPGESLLELMRATALRGIVYYRNINLDTLIPALASSHALIASNSASFPVNSRIKPERSRVTFPRFLKIAQEVLKMPFEQAIRRITTVPASLYGLSTRGSIVEGNIADLVITKGEEIKHVLVGGRVTIQDGQPLFVRAGRVLRRNA